MASSTGVGSAFSQLEDTLNEYFGQKAPALPTGVKDFIVKIAPWLVLLGVIVSIPAVLALFGLSLFVAPISMMGGANQGIAYLASMAILVVSVILDALAIPGLFKRAKQGWNFVFYASLLSLLQSAINLQLVSLVVGALISFYILFQIRDYYKD